MNRRDLGCIALLLAVATVFFSDVLFAGSNFFFRDLFLYHFPMKRIVRDAMLSGEFPFWNWSYSNGQPLAANPAYELWYPLQWLILAGSYPFGFALHIVAHVYLALVGMYVLLREMTLGRAASTFGALSFGMGGLLLGSHALLPTFFVWALAPLVAWSVLRTLREPAADRFAIAGLIAGVQLVIGEPVATAQVWLLLVAGALLTNRRRAVPVIAIVIAIAILVSAVQLIPAIDHARDSVRARGLPFSNVREFALPAARPLELIVPRLYGVLNPLRPDFWGGEAFNRGAPYLYSIYNGIAVAILVLAGFFVRARGALAVALLAIASYVLAIGDRTPLLHALYVSGIARSIRYPEKFIAFGVVALTVFAATIADRLLSGDARTRRAALIASAIVVLISAAPLITVARSQWVIGLAIAIGATVLIALLPSMRRRLWLLLATAFVLLDLIPLANDLVPRMPRSFFTPPEIVDRLGTDRAVHAMLNRAEWMNYDPNYKAIRGMIGPWFARNSLEPFTPASWGLRTALELDFDETALLPTHQLLDAMMSRGNRGDARWAEEFAAISNVDTIVDLLPLSSVVAQHEQVSDLRVVHLERLGSGGRYYCIGNGRVTVEEHANSARIVVDTPSPAPLVITITRHKYWHATIDGRETPIVPANIAYQAVNVPAGRHTIELRYRNPLIAWSGAVSAIAVIGCLLTVPIRRRRRLRSGS